MTTNANQPNSQVIKIDLLAIIRRLPYLHIFIKEQRPQSLQAQALAMGVKDLTL